MRRTVAAIARRPSAAASPLDFGMQIELLADLPGELPTFLVVRDHGEEDIAACRWLPDAD